MHKYTCWLPDRGQTLEDGDVVEAPTRREAAMQLVAACERVHVQYPVASGQEDAEVYVKGPDGEVWAVVVEGDPHPSYAVQSAAPLLRIDNA